jgi:hypothetical protein
MGLVILLFSSLLASAETIQLRLDIRNLVSQDANENYPQEKFLDLISSVNSIYSKCGVQFKVRDIVNLSAQGLPFPPKSEQDMADIAAKIHPHGFGKSDEAFPLTIAGRFNFLAPNHGVYLKALTWTFLNGPNDIARMHSMVARQHLDDPSAVEIIAHEFGHFFLLPHTQVPGNVMGAGRDFSADQCLQIRNFALNYYQALLVQTKIAFTN